MTETHAGKIAILVPTFNGGALLHETVASAAAAGLPAGSYAVLVSDNASTDGSIEALPSCDEGGAPIIIRRNASNLGRVENWNCAIRAAEALHFTYALFLMVGDVLKGTAVIELRDRMARSGACLGIASYEVIDAESRPLQLARCIRWHGDPLVAMPMAHFLAQSLARGAMLCGPLGANLYRIDGPVKLRFDAGDASHTDQMATASFARAAGPVICFDHPVSCWRHRPERFHSTMTVEGRLFGDLRTIERACREASITPDYPKIRATMLLRGLFYARGNLLSGWRVGRRAGGAGSISWWWLARLVLRRLANGTPWMIEA